MINTFAHLGADLVVVWFMALAIAQMLVRSRSALFAVLVRVHQELWILVPAGLLGLLWLAHDSDLTGRVIAYTVATLDAWWWWQFRYWPDDDNKWNKRRKKLAAKVAALRGKLVVVPATA